MVLCCDYFVVIRCGSIYFTVPSGLKKPAAALAHSGHDRRHPPPKCGSTATHSGRRGGCPGSSGGGDIYNLTFLIGIRKGRSGQSLRKHSLPRKLARRNELGPVPPSLTGGSPLAAAAENNLEGRWAEPRASWGGGGAGAGGGGQRRQPPAEQAAKRTALTAVADGPRPRRQVLQQPVRLQASHPSPKG